MLIHQKLIRADNVIFDFLDELKLWKEGWKERINNVGYLPIEIELDIKGKFDHVLDQFDRQLLGRLIAKGPVKLEEICISCDEWEQVLRDGDCSSAILVNTGLAYEDNFCLYPVSTLVDPRVRYLIGLENHF